MKIGFDFDKVFIDYPPIVPDELVDRLYKKKSNGTLQYRIPSKPEQFFRQLTHLPYLRPVIRHNLEYLKKLDTNHHELYLVSSRFGFLEQVTNRIVKQHGFDKLFDKLFFNFENKQPHLFKSEVIRDLKLDMYIDDDLALLKYVARHNKHTKFFWLNPKKSGLLTFNITGITDLALILPDMTSVTKNS